MSKAKKPMKVRVRTEEITEIDDKALNLFCYIAFGMNLEQTVQAVKKNADGKYDSLYAGETT